MQPLLKSLLTELHASFFKPNGFRKAKQRFRRELDGVMQEVDFQSSRWNSAQFPIVFYVNVRVGFLDIPMKDGRPALTGMCRLSGLASEAPPQFEVAPANYAWVRDELSRILPSAIAALPQYYEDVREYAIRGSHCLIPVPASWKKSE